MLQLAGCLSVAAEVRQATRAFPKFDSIDGARRLDRRSRADGSFCASVASIVVCVSTIVRLQRRSISRNVSRQLAYIAVPGNHHCEPLQVGAKLPVEYALLGNDAVSGQSVAQSARRFVSSR